MGLFDKIRGKNEKNNINSKRSTSDIDAVDEYARETILDEITDEKDLAKIAKTNSMMGIREKAIYKINDQTLLKEIYTENIKQDKNLPDRNKIDTTYRNVLRLVISKITDEQFLIEIANSDIDGEVRSYAVGNPNLKDKNLLIKLAKDDSYRYSEEYNRKLVGVHSDNVRIQAIYKIDDISILKEISDDKNPRVSRIAKERIEHLS